MNRLFMLIVLVAVLAAVSGCMSYGPHAVDGRVFNKSSGAIRARYETAQMEEKTRQGDLELAQAYTKQELARVKGGGLGLLLKGGKEAVPAAPLAVAMPPVAAVNAPVVLFRNNDRYKVYVTVTPVGVSRRVGDRWDFEVESGDTFVYPMDDEEAPFFRYGQNYSVTWWRDRSRGYSSNVSYQTDSFSVTPKKRGRDSIRLVSYNGGYDFTPAARRD